METIETLRMWMDLLRARVSADRTERGGVTDDVVMIAVMAAIAVFAAGILYTLVTGKVSGIKVDW